MSTSSLDVCISLFLSLCMCSMSVENVLNRVIQLALHTILPTNLPTNLPAYLSGIKLSGFHITTSAIKLIIASLCVCVPTMTTYTILHSHSHFIHTDTWRWRRLLLLLLRPTVTNTSALVSVCVWTRQWLTSSTWKWKHMVTDASCFLQNCIPTCV